MVRKLKNVASDELTLEYDIGYHLQLWMRDTRFRKMNKYLKDGVDYLNRQYRLASSSLEADKCVNDGPEDRIAKGVKRFIFIFKTRYLEATDIECPERPSPATFHILKDTIRKLIEAGSTPEEYLLWFYEQVANSQSLTPTYALVLSNAMFSKFLFSNAEELKQRRHNLAQSQMRWKAILCATLVYEETKDHALKDMFKRYEEGRLHEQILYEKAMEIARENGIAGIIEQKIKEEFEKDEDAKNEDSKEEVKNEK